MTTKRINPGEVQSSLIQNLITPQKRKKGPESVLDALEQEDQSAGRVDVGLSSTIASQFNPETMAAERAEKFKRIKELVASGKYHRSSEEIAGAVNEEIISTILSGTDAGNGVQEN